jgi:hypothetical protein
MSDDRERIRQGFEKAFREAVERAHLRRLFPECPVTRGSENWPAAGAGKHRGRRFRYSMVNTPHRPPQPPVKPPRPGDPPVEPPGPAEPPVEPPDPGQPPVQPPGPQPPPVKPPARPDPPIDDALVPAGDTRFALP